MVAPPFWFVAQKATLPIGRRKRKRSWRLQRPRETGLPPRRSRARDENLRFGVSGNERLEEIENFVLLSAGKLRDLFENVLGLALRAGAAPFGLLAAEEEIGGDAEGVRKLGKLFWTKRHRLAFPISDHPLGDLELVGKFLLGETLFLTGKSDLSSQYGTGF
jgi:hypothetical protein